MEYLPDNYSDRLSRQIAIYKDGVNGMNNQILMIKCVVSIAVTLLLMLVLENMSYGQGAKKMYWSEIGTIRRANLDGSNIEDVISDDGVRDITLDLQEQRLYYINGRHCIKRVNLDGTEVETVYDPQALDAEKVNLIHSPITITIDTSARKIYWGNISPPWRMTRSDLDGTNIQDIKILALDNRFPPITVDAEDIEIDVKAGKIYFQDSLNDNIARVNLDGTEYEILPWNTPYHDKIALDVINQRLYWTSYVGSRISRVALDERNVETLLSDLIDPTYIALDIRSNNIYWVERNNIAEKSKIHRANLDGTNVTHILTGNYYFSSFALDTEGVYDVSPDSGKLTTTWAEVKTID